MSVYRSARSLALMLFVLPLSACTVQIDKTFEMQPGSDLQLDEIRRLGVAPQGTLHLQGGTIMRINVSTSLLDYLDGTVNGDVEFLELLFASTGFRFFKIIDTNTMCIGLDLGNPGGGTFTYDVLNEAATFDVTVNSVGYATSPVVQAILPNGFNFPFHLESTMDMTLVDALALFTGGDLTITQPVDEYFQVLPAGYTIPFDFHIYGNVTLSTTDTFPTPPLVLECLDFFAARAGT